VLVLGVGNTLLSDEGVGVRAVEALTQRWALPPEVEVVDGGTAGMDLLDIFADRSHVIIVDAVRTGGPPGTVIRLEGDQVPALFGTRISPHQLGLSDVLAALQILEMSPRSLVVLGIEPASLDLGLELSPRLAACLDTLVDQVLGELRTLGLEATPRPPAAAP
jgi:hydrogenase maturation protease